MEKSPIASERSEPGTKSDVKNCGSPPGVNSRACVDDWAWRRRRSIEAPPEIRAKRAPSGTARPDAATLPLRRGNDWPDARSFTPVMRRGTTAGPARGSWHAAPKKLSPRRPGPFRLACWLPPPDPSGRLPLQPETSLTEALTRSRVRSMWGLCRVSGFGRGDERSNGNDNLFRLFGFLCFLVSAYLAFCHSDAPCSGFRSVGLGLNNPANTTQVDHRPMHRNG